MYFPKLETLQGFDIDFGLLEKLDHLFARADAQRLRRLSGTLVANVLNTDLSTALELLLKCVNLGIVKVNYEVECSECGNSDFVLDDLGRLTADVRVCRVCDTEYTPSSNLIWITFDLQEHPSPK